MQKYIFIFLVILLPISGAYAYDRELNEARKCINLYNQFEQKLKLPEDTLYAIGLHETSKIHSTLKKPISWPWTVNFEGKGYYFNSKKEASDFVKKQIRLGNNNIDVGCMQVNLKHHPTAFRSIDQAFTPRYNIAYAGKFLLEKYKASGSWGDAISHYHSSNPIKGAQYKDKVLKIARNMDKHKSLFRATKSINSAPKNRHKLAFRQKARRYKSDIMIPISRDQET